MIETNTHVYFWRGYMSNWHTTTGQIRDDLANATFDNTEQAFMYYKARFFKDDLIAHAIMLAYDPKKAKQLGRQVQGYNDKLWSCVRLGYMIYVNYLKYSQNKDLKDQLLATGSKILAEASPLDAIWGIGLTEEDAAAGKEWQGQNLLGIALMDVRKLIK